MKTLFLSLCLISTSLMAEGVNSITALARIGSEVVSTRDIMVHELWKNPSLVSSLSDWQYQPTKHKDVLDELIVIAAAREENDLFKSVKIGQDELDKFFDQWVTQVGTSRWSKLEKKFQVNESEIKDQIMGQEILKRTQSGAESLEEWKKQLRERYPVQYLSVQDSTP